MMNIHNYKTYIDSFERAISPYLYDGFKMDVDITTWESTIRVQLIDKPTNKEISIMETEMTADFKYDDITFYLFDNNELLVKIKFK